MNARDVSKRQSLSGLLGPALGGTAYSLWGIYPVLSIAAGCFFLSAVMEIFIKIPYERKQSTESILRQTKDDLCESIAYIGQKKPELAKLTLCCAGVNLVMSALMIIGLPVIVMNIPVSYTHLDVYKRQERCTSGT